MNFFSKCISISRLFIIYLQDDDSLEGEISYTKLLLLYYLTSGKVSVNKTAEKKFTRRFTYHS